MAEFEISPAKTRRSASVLSSCSGKISSCVMRVDAVRRGIRCSSSTAYLSGALGSVEDRMRTQTRTLRSMQTALNSCVTSYENAEQRSAGKTIPAWQQLAQGYFDQSNPGWKVAAGASSAGLSVGWPNYKDKKGFWENKREDDLGPFKGKELYKKGRVEEKDGQLSFPEMTKFASKKGSVFQVKGEAKTERALLQKEWGDDNAHAEVAVGKAEAHASAAAGMYVYDKDGKKMLAPGVEAKAGASVCVLSATGAAQVGDKNLGAGVDGEVNVGKAALEGEATAAVFKDGKVNPQIKVSGSAEAIAAEAKGSAHVNVAGVEGTVHGSVNFGVGAHADIGLVDGKVKCDIGASLGVGASVGFEVDVGGLVDNVVSGATALWTNFF